MRPPLGVASWGRRYLSVQRHKVGTNVIKTMEERGFVADLTSQVASGDDGVVTYLSVRICDNTSIRGHAYMPVLIHLLRRCMWAIWSR